MSFMIKSARTLLKKSANLQDTAKCKTKNLQAQRNF